MVIWRGRMVSYAACISRIRECQRATNSRRCVANGVGGPGRGRTRKYWRSSSKAAQNWAAEGKLPNPRIG